MKKYKKRFNFSVYWLSRWRLVRLHIVGTVSTYPHGWKVKDRKKKKPDQLNLFDGNPPNLAI
jgi:hypothetical protein